MSEKQLIHKNQSHVLLNRIILIPNRLPIDHESLIVLKMLVTKFQQATELGMKPLLKFQINQANVAAWVEQDNGGVTTFTH